MNIALRKENSTSGVVLQGGNKSTITDEDGNAVKDRDGQDIAKKTTDSGGVATFENLYPDVYYITEVKTNDGLSLLKDPIRVEAPMRMTKAEALANSLDTTDTTKVVWSDSEDCYLIYAQTYEVTDHAVFKLTPTGGFVDVWTFVPLGIGMTIFSCVAFVFFRRKKKRLS